VLKFIPQSVICLIFIFLNQAVSQNLKQREEALFKNNLEQYKTGRYDKAEQNFSLVIQRLPNSIFLTTNYLMLSKSKYKLDKYTESIDLGQQFLNEFSKSDYIDDMLFIMGNSYYRLDRFETAVKTWIRSLESSEDQRLISKLFKQISGTIRYKLSERDFKRLEQDIHSADGQLALQIAYAEKELENDLVKNANDRLTAGLKEYSNSKFVNQAKALLETGKIHENNNMGFALLLPLSGFNKDIASQIKEGVEFALDEFSKNNNININLVVKDYGQEIITAIQYYRELAQNKSILATLGPIENDICAACAALSDYEQLPIISPTATESDLVKLTDYFIQLNGTINMRAEKLAQYAIDSLKLKRFATFSPIDNHFIKMVDAFVKTIEAADGEIVAQQWYYPEDLDFSKHFMKLKQKGLKYAFMDSVLEVEPELSMIAIDSLYNGYIQSELEMLEESDTKIDSADIPVESIGGIFIPIFKEDLQFVAPQIAYSNIQSQYLGNGDWYDLEELKKNKNYIDGIIFGTDGYLNEESWDFKRFKNEFRVKLKKTPTIYNLIGYDTFKYMLVPIEDNKPVSRAEYLNKLRQAKSYDGIYRKIRINDNNNNSNIHMLKYEYGQILPLN
jgi:ABC-type branched-subunit amino acid transport system substrate-binding protein